MDHAADDVVAVRDELLRYYSDLDWSQSIAGISRWPVDSGGFADIYEGFRKDDRERKEPLALKFVRETNMHAAGNKLKVLRAWRQELSVWRSAAHPNIHKLLGLYLDPEDTTRIIPALVSARQINKNMTVYLRDLIVATPNEKLDVKLRLLRGVLHGLDYLHSRYRAKPVVHGDVKAENVLVSPTGEALLCDFGVSWTAAKRSVSFTVNRVGKGTPEHMAPEFFRSTVQGGASGTTANSEAPPANAPEQLTYTMASDIWAFGCLLYEILYGRPPWHDCAVQFVLLSLVRGERFLRPKDMDDAVWTIVDRCCAVDPPARPSAGDIVPLLVSLPDSVAEATCED